ncbi:MAG: hypothetical protein UX89_C0005G0041 [Parcubacteria group bacterium GW2011_GWA2_47_16]|nr:MAG: hypothetical protein UX89_C0005G0041 [Parcubacteria group bacterium GW2011_GWA2_47_16]
MGRDDRGKITDVRCFVSLITKNQIPLQLRAVKMRILAYNFTMNNAICYTSIHEEINF